MTDRAFARGGTIPLHNMRPVDHYDRQQVLMPNGTFMCSYTPVFVTEEAS